METALIAGLGPVFVFCMLLLVIFLCKSQGYESGQKRAGRQGENYVCDLICQVLKEKDLLFSNVSIEIEGKRTELDHIIVNNRDRKSTRLNSSHREKSRMPSSA